MKYFKIPGEFYPRRSKSDNVPKGAKEISEDEYMAFDATAERTTYWTNAAGVVGESAGIPAPKDAKPITKDEYEKLVAALEADDDEDDRREG